MIYKLNTEIPLEAFDDRCDLSSESSDNHLELTVGELKAKVANCDKVMLGDLHIPRFGLFNSIAIKIEHLVRFLDVNGPDLAAARIYIAKTTPDFAKDDFELLLVPCREVKNGSGDIEYYEDKLDPTSNAGVVSLGCRKPPGCTRGALLLTI